MLFAHKDFERKLIALEKKYDERVKVVFDVIRALMAPAQKPKWKIRFEVKEPRAGYGKKGNTSQKRLDPSTTSSVLVEPFYVYPVECHVVLSKGT